MVIHTQLLFQQDYALSGSIAGYYKKIMKIV